MSIRVDVRRARSIRTSRPIWGLATAACAALLPSTVFAQCVEGWLPGDGVTGVNATPSDVTTWDPDGPGPQGPLVVVCGDLINCAGAAPVARIGVWDPQSDSWRALDSTSLINVTRLQGLPDGRLLAWAPDGITLNGVRSSIAVYDGGEWTSLASPLTGVPTLRCVAMAPNGDIVVGGKFDAINGVPAQNVARWNGTTWSALGSGVASAVTAVDVLVGGDVVALTDVMSGFSVVASSVQRFAGGAWSTVGPVWTSTLSVIRALPNGEFLVAKNGSQGGVYRLESNLNGTFWQTYGSLQLRSISIVDIHPVDSNTVLVIGRDLRVGATDTFSLVRLPRGQAAVGLCGPFGDGYGKAAVLPGEQLVVAATANQLPVGGYIARWTGSNWTPLGQTHSRAVRFDRVAQAQDGGTFARGVFIDSSGATHVGLAKQEAGAWEPLPSGGIVLDGGLFAGADGLLASGSLSADLSSRGIAVRKNGVWTNYPLNALGVQGITQTRDGTLFVGGSYSGQRGGPMKGVAKWNGSEWVTAGSGLTNAPTWDWPTGQSEKSYVTSLVPLQNGALLALGEISLTGTRVINGVARWDGSDWQPMGSGIPGYSPIDGRVGRCATQLANGDVLVGGSGLSATDTAVVVVRWDGSTWTPFARCLKNWYPYAAVNSLARLVDGRIVASGVFDTIDGVPADGIAIWDGAWHPVGSKGPAGSLFPLSWCNVVPTVDGGFIATGDFNTMDGVLASQYAQWTCTMPCIADFDGDGSVTLEDFDAFVGAIELGSDAADTNRDGFLTFEDFDAFVTAFEAGC